MFDPEELEDEDAWMDECLAAPSGQCPHAGSADCEASCPREERQ